jgi:hypothetical protein
VLDGCAEVIVPAFGYFALLFVLVEVRELDDLGTGEASDVEVVVDLDEGLAGHELDAAVASLGAGTS